MSQHSTRTRIDEGSLVTILGITVVTWIAHFSRFNQLGLYEDDYFFIGQTMAGGWSSLAHLFDTIVLTFHQGRPLGFSIVLLAGYAAGILGSLKLVYLFAFFLAAINNSLFYMLACRLFRHPIFALSSTLAFALFPADNTKAFLTHIHVLPSITLILIAFLTYLSERRVVAYLFAAASLLCYETPFLLFLSAPLMQKKKINSLTSEVILNSSVVGLILALNVIMRKITADERLSKSDLLSFEHIINNSIVGPIVSVGTFFSGPLQSIAYSYQGILAPALGAFVIMASLFLANGLAVNGRSYSGAGVDQRSDQGVPSLGIPRLILLSTVLLILAYPLTLTVDASELGGRASRVHTAAIIGASILMGTLTDMAAHVSCINRRKHIASLVLAGYFSLLVANGLQVQHENMISWQRQQLFWSDVVRLAPDLSEGTVILVDAPGMISGDQLLPFDWPLPLILEQIYQFPKNWESKPTLYRLSKDWRRSFVESIDNRHQSFVLNNSNGTLWFYFPWEPPRRVKLSNTILLSQEGVQLVRVKKFSYGNQDFQLKSLQRSNTQQFAKSTLYGDLVNPAPTGVVYLEK